ncbi:YfhO family protein [Clostridium sp. Ade.TY]|uniref:YfhO family protein n=1 Tax=Clostridium sp. Ade.TY TaxID=1391647 RepID=UPI0003F550B0|nr:YfhO family protein [Clostridium sp. Ade.TY]
MKLKNKIKESPIVIYTIIFLILFLAFYLIFIILNKNIIWLSDGINQHYSILHDFNEMIRKFLSNPSVGFSEWDWSIGYGSDVIGTYSYYIIGDPISYLSLLFPLDKLDLAYDVLIALRLYLAGLAFIIYVKSLKFSNKGGVLGGLSYAFSSFVMMTAIRHPYFINPLIILPIVFITIDKLIIDKKKYLFSLMVAISMISNFYFCYMIAIISIVYAFIRYFDYKRFREIKFSKYLFNLIIYFFIGILMSSIILFPTLYSISTSSRITSDNTQTTILIYPIVYYINLIYSSISSGSYPFWTIITAPILTFIFLPLFFRKRKKYFIYFYMLIIFSVMTLVPIFGSIMNGFSSISNRWTLIFAFIASVIICIGFDELKNTNKKDYLYAVFILIFYGIFAFIKIELPIIKNEMFPVLFWGMVMIFIIFYYSSKNTSIEKNNKFFMFILILLSINIAFNNYYRYSPNGQNLSKQFIEKGESLKYYTESFGGAEEYINEMDNSFYRISKTDDISRAKTRNNSLILNYNGIDSYLSVNNGYISEFSRSLNNRSYTPNSPIINFDNRFIVNNIMGVKYYIGYKNKDAKLHTSIEKIQDIGKFSVYKNKNEMPFAYVYKNILSEDEFSRLNGLEKEESLVYAASVSDGNRISNITNLKSSIESLKFDTKGTTAIIEDNKIIVKSLEDKIVLNLKDNNFSSGEIYLDIANLKYNPLYSDLKSNNNLIQRLKEKIKPLFKFNKGDEFSLKAEYDGKQKSFKQPDSLDASGYFNIDSVLINLGYYKNMIKENNKITIKFNKMGEYSFDSLKVLNLPIDEYLDDLRNLKNNKMTIEKMDQDIVVGNINSYEDGVIMFQIPYSKGWTLKIDGDIVETFPVNKAFLGANLNSGEHKIELTYKTPFLRIGIVCTLIGLIIFLITIILDKKQKK